MKVPFRKLLRLYVQEFGFWVKISACAAAMGITERFSKNMAFHVLIHMNAKYKKYINFLM
jgi:hypothetical protein